MFQKIHQKITMKIIKTSLKLKKKYLYNDPPPMLNCNKTRFLNRIYLFLIFHIIKMPRKYNKIQVIFLQDLLRVLIILSIKLTNI